MTSILSKIFTGILTLLIVLSTSFVSKAADFYWVGGSGDWSDFATHWATTSGGATFHANAPTATDNVFFDANSALGGGTVTLDIAASILDFNYDVAGAGVTFNAVNPLTVNGDATFTASSVVDFEGANIYNFIGDFTAANNTSIDFRNTNTSNFNNISIDVGSSFRLSTLQTTNVSGTFSPNGICSDPITISATGATSADLDITNPQSWGGVVVTLINSTGANITVNSVTATMSGNFTNNTTGGRTLYWVGGTGNWNDEANWSLTSDGLGGECLPTTGDDVVFDLESFDAAGQTVTIDGVGGACRNMTWTAGVTNNPSLAGVAPLTITGSLDVAATMTQTGLAPTYEGQVTFNSNSAQIITTNGIGFNRVNFSTASTGSWTLQDDMLVQNTTLLNSGVFNTNGQTLTTGSLSANNASIPARSLNLGASTINLTSDATTVLDFRNDTNFTFNAGTSSINISGANTTVETGEFSKIFSNITYTGAGSRLINTNDTNPQTFRDITVSDNGTFTINGASQKTYGDITIGDNVTSVVNGVDTNLGNTINSVTVGDNGSSTFNGGYDVNGNFVVGDNHTITFNGTANNDFVADFTVGAGSTARFTNTPAASNNDFADINLGSGATFAFSSAATSSVSGNVNVVGSCAAPITLTSNSPPNQARLTLANPLNLVGVTVQNIDASSGAAINVSNGTLANNSANVTGNNESRDLYWVHSVAGGGSIGNWYDAANWSASSGGAGGECPPTIYDNVIFDLNSFSAAGQIVDMDADAFCRNMDWTGVTNDPLLQSIGEDTDLHVGGNLDFGDVTVAGSMTIGTGGTNPNEIRYIYFVATEALAAPFPVAATLNNTINLLGNTSPTNQNTNGRRFKRAYFNKNAAVGNIVTSAATWTLASDFNLSYEFGGDQGQWIIEEGNVVTNNFNAHVRRLIANGADGSLDIGNSDIRLRGTGLNVDFRNDANFTFVTPAANAIFNFNVATNSIIYTGAEAKTLPDMDFNADDVDVFGQNSNNRITFRDIEVDANADVDITGNSPKTYSETLNFPNGVNTLFTGSNGTTNSNIFTGNVTFGTGVQANFIGDNEFQGNFIVGSTVDNANGITFTGNGRNQFAGNVTLNGASGFFSLQNTSANPNTFTNVSLTNVPNLPLTVPSTIWEFSPNSPNTVSGIFALSADCSAPITVRSSSGVPANVAFANNQTWTNAIVQNINETGAGIVTVLSATNVGGNSNIVFNTTNRDLYWIGGTGDWNNTNNWSATTGGTGGECIPTLDDNVFFDANSFTAAGETVTVNIDAQARNIDWTGADANGTPILTGTNAFDFQIGGDVTFIPAMDWDFQGETIFRNSTTTPTNTITSAGQDFDSDVTFWDTNIPSSTIWEIQDAFVTTETLNLVSGEFSTGTNQPLTVRVLDVFGVANANTIDPDRTLSLNSSVTTITGNGNALDLRGNTTNFTLNSNNDSELRLTTGGNFNGNLGTADKTLPNLFISTAGTVSLGSFGGPANRITFRNITGLSNGTTFNISGNSAKTYGNILFQDNVFAQFNGTENTAARNIFDGTVAFGDNTRINFQDDNEFRDAVTIESTTNNGDAVRFWRDNTFLAGAPLTFSGPGRARWSLGQDNQTTIQIFNAPVRLEGTRNIVESYGNATSSVTFNDELFIESTDAAQADIEFDVNVNFDDDVEFGDGAGGTAAPITTFRRGVNFTGAPDNTFTVGDNSRIEFRGASNLEDINVGENTLLRFWRDLTVDDMRLSRFDVVEFPYSSGSGPRGTTTITGFLVARGTSCDEWIRLSSRQSPIQADINFDQDHTGANGLEFAFMEDINNIGGNAVEASPDPIVDVSNNDNITFIGATSGRTLFWVRNGSGSYSGNWNDLGTGPTGLNHWSFASGGMPSGCIPTPSDDVVFDNNSFPADPTATYTVTLENFFSYSRDFSWTVSGNRRVILDGTSNNNTLQVYGNVLFPIPSTLNATNLMDRNWNQFRGTIEFRGTNTVLTKSLTFNDGRFFGPIVFDAEQSIWQMQDNLRSEGGGRSDITINYGELETLGNNIRLQDDWTINAPLAGLNSAEFIAGTSTVTFDGNADSQIRVRNIDNTQPCTECASSIRTECTGSPFYNLTIEKPYNRRTETFDRSISVLHNFHIIGGTFEDEGYQVRGNNTGTGTVYMANNTLFSIGVNNRASIFPTCYPRGNITLAIGDTPGNANDSYNPQSGSTKASIVDYRSPDDQLIRGLDYGSLRLRSVGGAGAGNDQKWFTGSATINGNLLIQGMQRVRDMGFQIIGNNFNNANAANRNRFRMDNDAALYLGTNENVAQNTYVSPFIPDAIPIPPTGTEAETNAAYVGAVAPDNIATEFPKFTVGNLLDDRADGGKMDLRGTSYIIYNAGSPQEVASGFTYSVVRLRATGVGSIVDKTVTPHTVANDDMRVRVELRIEEQNSLIDDGNQIVGVGTPDLEARANSRLVIGNQTIATAFPTNFNRANIDLDADDHETIYNADLDQVMSTEPVYGNLTLTAPNLTLDVMVEKVFTPDGTLGSFTTADIDGNLIINPRNHLLDQGNQIIGRDVKSVTMNSQDVPRGRSWLTLGTNGANPGDDVATEFPQNFGTSSPGVIELNDFTTVVYNTGSEQNQNVRGLGLNGASATGTDSYYNLIAQSGGESVAEKWLQAPMRIRNNFSILEGNFFRDRRHQITGSVASGQLEMEQNTHLRIGTNATAAPTVFPTGYERGRINLNDASLVSYVSRSATTQLVSSEPIYGSLLLDANHTTTGGLFNKRITAQPISNVNNTLTVDGNLTVDYRIRFADDSVQIVGNSTNNLLVEEGSVLVLGNEVTATLFPTNFQRVNTDLHPNVGANTTTVIYNSSIAQNIAGGTPSATASVTELNNPIYGNVILRSASGAAVTKSLLGSVDINGDLTIEGENTLETTAGNHTINLAGDWECEADGAFNSQLGKVILDGATQQEVTTNAQRFHNLEANNTGAGFLMIDNIYIKSGGRVGFIDGLFRMNGAPALPAVSPIEMIFEDGADIDRTVGTPYPTMTWINNSAPFLSADGPSNESHVVGRVRKTGNSAFMFPIGNGVNYAPAGVGATSSNTNVFSAYYVGPRLPTLDGYDVDLKEPTIITVSNLEYWIVNRDNGTDPAFAYLSWDNPRSQAFSPQFLKVLRWDGSLWTDKFNGGYTNASAKGVVASQAPVTDFSPFTLGTENRFNPLPVDLLAFDAVVEGESVKVTWQTTNEIDNSHFLVERSQDGTDFNSIGRVGAKGSGLPGTFDYQFWDVEPFSGLSYYRLNQFDLGGGNEYSPVVSVLFEKNPSGVSGNIVLYPNPNEGARFYLNLNGKLQTDAQISIIDMAGREVHKQEVMEGTENAVITPLHTLKSGSYILRFVTPQKTVTKLFVVE